MNFLVLPGAMNSTIQPLHPAEVQHGEQSVAPGKVEVEERKARDTNVAQYEKMVSSGT